VNLNQGARDDVLECLREAEPIEPEIIMAPQEEPEPEPAPVMMAEPDAPLLATPPVAPTPVPAPAVSVQASAAALAAYTADAAPEDAEPVPVKAQTPVRRSRVPLWTWPLAAAVVIGAVAAPVTWYMLQEKEAAAPTVSVAEIKAQEIAPAPVKSVDAPPAASPTPVAPVIAPATTLPLAAAQITPPAPVVEEKPVVAPAPVDKNALVMDANQVKAGTTRFLNGTWRLSIGSPDPITGKATSMRIDMKNNKGNARVTLGDNVVCKAELYIQDQIHRHRLRTQRAGHDFQLWHAQLVAEERHHIEPVGLIFEHFQRALDLLFAAAFLSACKLGKRFTQPAVDPGLVEEIGDFIVAPGEGETRSVAHVVLDRRELRGRAFIGLDLGPGVAF